MEPTAVIGWTLTDCDGLKAFRLKKLYLRLSWYQTLLPQSRCVQLVWICSKKKREIYINNSLYVWCVRLTLSHYFLLKLLHRSLKFIVAKLIWRLNSHPYFWIHFSESVLLAR